MKCKVCGSEIRAGSIYCHQCGQKLDRPSVNRGRGSFIFSLLLLFLFPVVYQAMVFIYVVNLLGKVELSRVLGLVLLVIIFLLFIFLWKGKLWARYPIGVVSIITQFLYLISVFLLGQPIINNLTSIITSIFISATAIMLMVSKDIEVYIEHKNTISP